MPNVKSGGSGGDHIIFMVAITLSQNIPKNITLNYNKYVILHDN